jgi:hypothetical protein
VTVLPRSAERSSLLRFPLPGGVDVVRLPSAVTDEVLDEALRSEAAWLLLDATGAEERTETVSALVASAVDRSSRATSTTCLVCRRRLLAGADEVATFATVEDACQARLLADAGFGTGWAPVPRIVHRSRQLVAL